MPFPMLLVPNIDNARAQSLCYIIKVVLYSQGDLLEQYSFLFFFCKSVLKVSIQFLFFFCKSVLKVSIQFLFFFSIAAGQNGEKWAIVPNMYITVCCFSLYKK